MEGASSFFPPSLSPVSPLHPPLLFLSYLEKLGIPRSRLADFLRRYPQVLHANEEPFLDIMDAGFNVAASDLSPMGLMENLSPVPPLLPVRIPVPFERLRLTGMDPQGHPTPLMIGVTAPVPYATVTGGPYQGLPALLPAVATIVAVNVADVLGRPVPRDRADHRLHEPQPAPGLHQEDHEG